MTRTTWSLLRPGSSPSPWGLESGETGTTSTTNTNRETGTTSAPEIASTTTQALLDAVNFVVGCEDRANPTIPPSDGDEQWDEDASILLLGIRGTGKTSLGILAASCTGFRIVDADQNFYRETGLPRAVFASRHGFEEYRRRELVLMHSLLQENPTRCIIVCGPGSAEGTGQELLTEFKKRHPVIYIIRGPEEIDQYLRRNDVAKISRLSQLITPSYRSLSNFEFYNLSEPADPDAQDAYSLSLGAHLHCHPSLILKHVEYDFLRLIYSIRNQGSCPSVLKARHSLSFLAPESKPFTYALPIPIERALEIASDLRSTDLIVDALELVIDLDRFLGDDGVFDHAAATTIAKVYHTLRRNVRLPTILHVRAPDGNARTENGPDLWSSYVDVLRYGLRLAPEYLTLDLRCDPQAAQKLTAQKHSTKIIGHFVDNNPVAGAWDLPSRQQLVSSASQYSCDLVRICQPAISPADNVAVQRFVSRVETSELARLPLIAYNTGHIGRASQYINSILTPVRHDLVSAGSPSGLGDGMLTVQAAQNALYASFTLDPLVFGIFGNAVTSAMSPVMHNAAFKFCGMPHHYRTFQSSSLHNIESFVRDPNFGGASISAPFKKEIFSVLDYVSPEAQAIGAVNTLIPLRSPELQSLVNSNRAGPVVALFGDNTDWIGIHTCIKRNLSPINAVKSRTTALVLGAGGMAQAAVYAAIRLGVKTIFVHNRTQQNAEKLVNQFNGKSFSVHNIDLAVKSSSTHRSGSVTPPNQKTGPIAVHAMASMDEPWPAGMDPPTIIVGCISRVSENGKPLPEIVLPDSWLMSQTGGVLVELAYNPINTPLIQQAQSLSRRGWIPVHGLQVLPEQGIAQFELFTGRKAPEYIMRTEVRKYVESTSGPRGFMGS